MWADAIYINRSDFEERAQQTRLMRTFYGQAERVTAWLGPESDMSSRAMSCIKGFMSLRTHLSLSLIEVEGIGDLVARTYWSRVWIIREVTASLGRVEIFCRDNTLPYDEALPAF